MYLNNRITFINTLLFLFISLYFIACRNNVNTTDVSLQKEVQIVSGDYKSSYIIFPENSTIKWYGGFKFGSLEHNGLIKIKEGQLQMDGEKIVAGTIFIDMKSIKNVDISDAKENIQLISHLKSKDFFYVDSFANASLNIKKIVYPEIVAEQSNKENLCDVYAYLTIKGITHEINFPASYSFINDQINIKTNFKIDRNKWGINYSNASTINILKEKIIDDMITIDINVFAKKE
jgi:polyisoprenoid-binding protein YceI